MAKRERTLLHSRHKIKLDTIRGVLSEQCRLYRCWTNDKISASGLTSGMSALKEVRSTLEALNSTEANVSTSRPIQAVTIVSVPANHYFRRPRADIDGLTLENGALMIEHDEKPALQLAPGPPEPEAQPSEEAMIAELSASIEELARRAGVSLVESPEPSPDSKVVRRRELEREAAAEAERRAAALQAPPSGAWFEKHHPPQPVPPRRTQRPPWSNGS